MVDILSWLLRQIAAAWLKYPFAAVSVWAALCTFSVAWAQDRQAPQAQGAPRPGASQFERRAPAVGTPLPEVALYDADGRPLRLGDLRGHYTVLIFGCLT